VGKAGSKQKGQSILTIDYEDWFHVLGHGLLDPSVWEKLPVHVETDTLRLLDLLDQHSARATFFVVGWLGERTPDVLKEIIRRGHHVASHGYYHIPPNKMSEFEFRKDLLRSKEAIENATGISVLGYRAPGFGVRDCSFCYLDVLQKHGFLYDSSVFPGLFPGRGQGKVPSHPYRPDQSNPEFWEVPISAIGFGPVRLVFSGGGFLRLLPGWIVRSSATRSRRRGESVVYYLHPRDVNPDGPTVDARWWQRLRYYGGRYGLLRKLEDILSSEKLTSIEESREIMPTVGAL